MFSVTSEITKAPKKHLPIIIFRENNGGTVVQYQAELNFSGFWKLLSPLMQLIFNRTGDKAAAGLEKCLNVRELVKI